MGCGSHNGVGTNLLGAVDAPAAMMANGKILCALGQITGFDGPPAITRTRLLLQCVEQSQCSERRPHVCTSAMVGELLDLPDGTVLLVGGQNLSSALRLHAGWHAIGPRAAGHQHDNGKCRWLVSYEWHRIERHFRRRGLRGRRADEQQLPDRAHDKQRHWQRVLRADIQLEQHQRSDWEQSHSDGVFVATKSSGGNVLADSDRQWQSVRSDNFTYSPPPVRPALWHPAAANAFVRLNWNASAGATAYNVKRSWTVGGYYATIATVTNLSFTNTGLTNGLAAYYKVSAIGSGGPSSDSAAVMAVPSVRRLSRRDVGQLGVILQSSWNFYRRAHIRQRAGRRLWGDSANLLGPALCGQPRVQLWTLERARCGGLRRASHQPASRPIQFAAHSGDGCERQSGWANIHCDIHR